MSTRRVSGEQDLPRIGTCVDQPEICAQGVLGCGGKGVFRCEPVIRRRAHTDFTTGLTANLELVEALRPIAARHGRSVAEVAVAWVLAWPGITGAIVGARKPAQVDGWIRAGSLPLTPADLEEIATAITVSGVGSGPARHA